MDKELEVLEAIHQVSERLARVETKLDKYNNVRETAFKAQNLAQRNSEEIEELKESLRWSTRSVIATIFGLVAKVLYDIFIGGAN